MGELDRLAQDVRFAVRLLVRTPAFTITALAVLAVGVGLNLAAFQVLDAAALTWLPVRTPETLVRVERRSPRGHGTSFSYPEFGFYSSRSTSLSSAFALVYGSVTLGDDVLHRVDAEFASANYFSDLGARPLAGRLLEPADDRPGAAPVIVLSERLWTSRFGADPGVVGQAVPVNGHPFVVAGIAPSTFVGVDDLAAAAWMPITRHALAFVGSALLDQWDPHGSARFYARVRD